MQPKYRKKQRVKIISVKSSKKDEYLNEIGVIIDSMYAGKLGRQKPWGHIDYMHYSAGDYYIYKVRLDKNNRVATVVEEELDPLIP